LDSSLEFKSGAFQFSFTIAGMRFGALLLIVLPCKALRHQQRDSGTDTKHNASVPYGSREWTMVDRLFTFGAPMSTGLAVENPMAPDGCWKGWRVVREGGTDSGQVDLVSSLLSYNGFLHPKMPSYVVNSDLPPKKHECGWKYDGPRRSPTTSLHARAEYVRLSESLVGTVAGLALDRSYDQNSAYVAVRARQAGWRLVGTALAEGKWFFWSEDEVTHLYQHPETLDCMLSFEGTSSVNNWADNLKFFKTSFCKLPGRVHRGFAEAMRVMTKSEDWHKKIKPHLPYCNTLDVVGHSLGGAISTLFSACANNGYVAKGTDDGDIDDVTWTKQTPVQLPYL